MENINNKKEIILEEEIELKWRDLYKIRQYLADNLKQYNFTRQQTDPIIIIISELLECAFKYIDKKIVTIVLKYASDAKDQLLIRIHHPISSFQSGNLKVLLLTISKINQCTNIDKLFIDSLREATGANSKVNTFRFVLIRKTAGGSPIQIRKSQVYTPGIVISIPFNLNS